MTQRKAGIKLLLLQIRLVLREDITEQCFLESLTDVQFKVRGIEVAAVYSPFHPSAGQGPYKRNDFSRKPNPGMLFDAKRTLI